jgi:hypothetical protein
MTASFFGTGQIVDLDGKALAPTHLPVGTRVRVVNFAPDYDGLTAVVTGAGTGEWADWTEVAMDRRVTGNCGLMFRPEFLKALPEPTVFLVKATYTCVACGETVPVAHQPAHCDGHDVPAAGQLTDRQERLAAAERIAVLEQRAERAEATEDQGRAALVQALDRNAELRAELEGQLARTEAARAQLALDLADTQARTSRRIAVLERQLEKAASIAVDHAIDGDELRSALHRANQRAQTASDAAEEYRADLAARDERLREIGALVDGALGLS